MLFLKAREITEPNQTRQLAQAGATRAEPVEAEPLPLDRNLAQHFISVLLIAQQQPQPGFDTYGRKENPNLL